MNTCKSIIIMKFLIPITFLFIHTMTLAQTTTIRELKLAEERKVFNPDVRKELGIDIPIFKVMHYTDQSGEYYFVMAEKSYQKDGEKVGNKTIKGYCFGKFGDRLIKQWSLRDLKKKDTGDVGSEQSIWFYTRFSKFEDLDGDGLVEPIIVYGTSGINGPNDGRVKILTYYKDKKYAVRHQNGILDNERNTQIDGAFYHLPDKIQQAVRKIMHEIQDSDNAIFPAGWEKAMDNQRLYFDEN